MEKTAAYRAGYALKHAEKLRKTAADHYRKSHPEAAPYTPSRTN